MHFIVVAFFLCLSSVLAVDDMLLLYALTPSSSQRSEQKSRCAILKHILGLEGKQSPNPNTLLKPECPILPWNFGVLKEDLGYDTWWHECSKSNEVPMTIGVLCMGLIYVAAILTGLAKALV